MNQYRRVGYDFTMGMFHAIGVIVLIGMALQLGLNAFQFNVDDSDYNGFNRSGLTVHTDHKTGLQYLSDGNGALIQRTWADGSQMIRGEHK